MYLEYIVKFTIFPTFLLLFLRKIFLEIYGILQLWIHLKLSNTAGMKG